jgi:hypothetical protein
MPVVFVVNINRHRVRGKFHAHKASDAYTGDKGNQEKAFRRALHIAQQRGRL